MLLLGKLQIVFSSNLQSEFALVNNRWYLKTSHSRQFYDLQQNSYKITDGILNSFGNVNYINCNLSKSWQYIYRPLTWRSIVRQHKIIIQHCHNTYIIFFFRFQYFKSNRQNRFRGIGLDNSKLTSTSTFI